MRILIIDDEISTRESIKVLAGFNEKAGDEIYEARNGLEGYQMIGKVRPDIIFLDMNMPVLDGADLLGMLDEKEFPAKIIVVSGYTDFRYMKAAVLKHYVVDYIQKPIDEAQLRAAVKKITGEERTSGTDEPGAAVEEDAEPAAILCGIFVENVMEIVKKNYNSSMDLFQYFLMCQLEHQLKDIVPYQQSQEIYQYAFFFALGRENANGLKEALNRTIQNLENRYGIKAYALYSDEIEGQDTHKVYMEICEALNYIDMNGSSRVIKRARPLQLPKTGREPALWAGELYSFAENRNKAGYESVLEALEQDIYGGKITIYELKILMSGLVFELGKRMNAKGIDAELIITKRMSQLYSGKTLFSKEFSRKWLMDVAAQVWEQTQKDGAGLPDKLQQILHYIQENYNRRISLSDVAGKFYFNTSTVSRMFVKYMGINYIDYVNNLRFEKAIELMEIPELSISQIADRTGFESSSYFSKQFKKKYGISPQEYRRGK